MLIKLIIIFFVIFVLWRVIIKFKKDEITVLEFIFWFIFWLVVGGVTLVLRQTDFLAQFLGVEKAADLVVYLSLILIFYLIFKIFVQLDCLEMKISKLVRHLALKNQDNEDKLSSKK